MAGDVCRKAGRRKAALTQNYDWDDDTPSSNWDNLIELDDAKIIDIEQSDIRKKQKQNHDVWYDRHGIHSRPRLDWTVKYTNYTQVFWSIK